MASIRTRPERLAAGVLLTAVGGYLDAYTFVGHGGVFANAQTGNVVVFAVDASAGRWHEALLRVPAIVAFVLGAIAVEIMARPAVRAVLRRPPRIVLAIEVVVFAVLAALPSGTPNLVYTATISFAASLQFSTFRMIADTPYTSILATGNLRGLVAAVVEWRAEHSGPARRHAVHLGATVTAFVLGAAAGAAYTRHSGSVAIWVASAVLAGIMVHLIIETRQLEHPGDATDPAAPATPVP